MQPWQIPKDKVQTERGKKTGGACTNHLTSGEIKGPGWIITAAGPITEWLIGPKPHTVWDNIVQSVQTQCQHGASLVGAVLSPYPETYCWPMTFQHVQLQNAIFHAGCDPEGCQQRQMVADPFYCRSLEVTINISHKQARKLAHWTRLQECTAFLKEHQNSWLCSYRHAPVSYRRPIWGHWQRQRSIASVSTFLRASNTTNHPCVVTVSQVKCDFLPPQRPALLRLSQR